MQDPSLLDFLAGDHPAVQAWKKSADGTGPKSLTLEQLVDRMKICPWSLQVAFDGTTTEYAQGVLRLGPGTDPDQIVSFAFAAYAATHQELFKLYASEQPLPDLLYGKVQVRRIANAVFAQIHVKQELHLDKRVDFAIISPVLDDPMIIDVEALDPQLFIAVLAHIQAQNAPYPMWSFYMKSYQAYVENYEHNRAFILQTYGLEPDW